MKTYTYEPSEDYSNYCNNIPLSVWDGEDYQEVIVAVSYEYQDHRPTGDSDAFVCEVLQVTYPNDEVLNLLEPEYIADKCYYQIREEVKRQC